MATQSRILAWKIPWSEKPGGLQSMGVTKGQTRLSDYHSALSKRTLGHIAKSGLCHLLAVCLRKILYLFVIEGCLLI